MTISTLIAELQKLQALHGDLPVTYAHRDDACRAPTEHIKVDDVYFHEDGKYDDGFCGDTLTGPHIHLS